MGADNGEVGLPALEYCTLNRACVLLGCELEDILHWWEIGAIDLCVKLISARGDISFYDDIEVVGKHLSIHLEYSNKINFSLYSYIYTTAELYADEHDYGDIFTHLDCRAEGFWKIKQYTHYNDDIISVSALTPYASSDDFLSKATLWVNVKTQHELLYIMREGIESIEGVKRRILPNRYTGNAEFIPVERNIPKETIPKTANARAQFIKTLLYVFFDEEHANNPRKYLDNPDSEIRKLLAAKGIHSPSGKTVQNWIESIDIPFKSED